MTPSGAKIGPGARLPATPSPAPPPPPAHVPSSVTARLDHYEEAAPKTETHLLEEVIVEDVLEYEDEDEDDGDKAAPTTAARASSPLPAPRLLPHPSSQQITPFFPAKQSAGRSKALRWMEDSGDSDFVCTSSAAQSSYLGATRRAFEVTASPVPAAPCEGESSASRPVVITKKGQCCRRRAKTRDTDGLPVVSPRQAARVLTHQRLGPRPVMRVPVHQHLGPQHRPSASGGRHHRCREPGPGFMSNARRPSTSPHIHPPNALPRRHVPRAAVPVDVDGFMLVQSHRHGHRHSPPQRRHQLSVLPSLVGLYFSCLAGDHIVARCTFPSRCLFYLSMMHRARNCKHGRSPQCLSSNRVREPPRHGQRRAARGNLGFGGGASQDSDEGGDSQLGPRLDPMLCFVDQPGALCDKGASPNPVSYLDLSSAKPKMTRGHPQTSWAAHLVAEDHDITAWPATPPVVCGVPMAAAGDTPCPQSNDLPVNPTMVQLGTEPGHGLTQSRPLQWELDHITGYALDNQAHGVQDS
ncbi:unnamed protein product [Miscanthus lutarioriparius]|uniref:Uncharacterized protein n=1 Tax=Miscanthus lutarioriparius TaxID=422564 RepID=A0A811Q905_9POAL|nr:unnamed protein product [Miscanthus lutarioriparius]